MKEYRMVTTFSLSVHNTVKADSYEEAVEKAQEIARDEFCEDMELLRYDTRDFAAYTEEM